MKGWGNVIAGGILFGLLLAWTAGAFSGEADAAPTKNTTGVERVTVSDTGDGRADDVCRRLTEEQGVPCKVIATD